MERKNRLVSEIPQSLWGKIKLFKKFPGVKKTVIVRQYIEKERAEQRKSVRFVGDFVGADLIAYINSEYQKTYDKHLRKNVKYIKKEMEKKNAEEKLDRDIDILNQETPREAKEEKH